jgi:hypothetical protein
VFEKTPSLDFLALIREGAVVTWMGGALSSLGDVFLRFRAALLSRESVSELLDGASESEV